MGNKHAHTTATFVSERRQNTMRIENGRIEKGDELYATLTVAGSTMVELKKVEASSIEEIMRKLRKTASRYTGLAKVHIRNRTRGWAIQKAMFASNPLQPQYTCDNTGQYALQF